MQEHLLIDRTTLAKKLGCSIPTVKKLIEAGKLPKPWHSRFFYWPHIARMLEQSERPVPRKRVAS